jgi:predicted secreted protein
VTTIEKTQNGSVVSVALGETFTVRLPENPGSTGYRWQFAPPAGLAVISDTFEPPTSGLIGAPGVRIWTLRATVAGALPLEMTQVLGTMPQTEAAETFRAMLKVG